MKNLTDARQVEWQAAKVAAERIAKICADAVYVAPDALGLIQGKIASVCQELDVIVRSLMITPPGGEK